MSAPTPGLRKLLHVLPRISDGREHTLAEVARHAGVSEKELTRLLTVLVDRFDLPGGFVEGVQVYLEADRVSVFSQHFLRPMRLTRAELGALELGLAMLRVAGAREDRDVVESALQRLRKLITSLPGDEQQDGLRHAELSSGGDRRHLATVRDALRTKRVVNVCYRSGSSDDAQERRVRPYGLVYSSGQWYIVGYCESSGEVRHFRLDRVEGAEATDSSYRIPASFSIEQSMSDFGVFNSDSVPTMKVRYSSRIARWIAEREKRELNADGTLTLEHPVADREWAVRHVLQYGPDAEVLEPVELRTVVGKRLGRMLEGREN